jgi:PTH1 family peptidyl-tRNA hydrolase
MSPSPLLLIGLGNPGEKYARHRHNVGWRVVDAIADAHGFGPARQKFQSEVREGWFDGPGGGRKAIILKPLTYMNLSGQAVGEASRFYKAELADIVVFHDDLDLAPGKIKVKVGGGNAGHNGLRSLDAHLGADYRRVRIGIGHPGDKSRVTGHVLGDFAKSDAEWLEALVAAIAKSAPMLLDGDSRFSTAVAATLHPNEPKQPAAGFDASDAAASPPAAPKMDAPSNPFMQALAKLLPHKK